MGQITLVREIVFWLVVGAAFYWAWHHEPR